MRFYTSIFILLLFFIRVNAQNQYDSVSFISPVDIPLVLAGNFAELRTNHFHTGIDIKTQGVEGKTIRAVEDGFVSRIKISHWGYGKVVYITHPNGYTSVYAHLKSFNEEITKYIRDYQYANQTETFDITLNDSTILINRGDKIALSGNTGSSTAPHLHFEIRDTKTEHAINPLLFKFDIKDNIKPQLNGVKIYALNNGFIEGHHKDIKIPTQGSNGNYTLKRDVIEVDGEIGFAIHAIDRLNGAHNKCGAFNIKLKIDDSLIFEQSLTEIDFNQNRYINAYKDYEEYHKNRFHYHRSFLLPNNPLNVYDSVKNNGKIIFTDNKIHNITYEVSDVYGNLSTVKFKIKHNSNMPKSDYDKFNENDYSVYYNTNDSIELDGLKLIYEDSTFYENTSLPINILEDSNFQSDKYSIEGEYIPVQKYFALMINASRVSEKHRNKVLIAKINNNSIQKTYGGDYKNGYIKSEIKELGDFALVLDTIPPIIKAINIHNNKEITKNQRIVFNVSDDISGITSYNTYINDQWILSNYSPQKNTLIIPQEELNKVTSGTHTLKVVVGDERKNITEINIPFSLL